MAVGREYRSHTRGVGGLSADAMHVRLTKRLAEAINGFDLSKAHVGDVLTVTRREGLMLIMEGWAVPCAPELPRVEAADPGKASLAPAVGAAVPSSGGIPSQGRRQTIRGNPRLPREWEVATAHPVNALLVGSPRVTQECLRALRPRLRPPIVTIRRGRRLTLPSVADVGTVILHDIGSLAPADQQRLIEWTESAYTRAYVISTSRTALVRNVVEGTFKDTLYYRLNMLYIDASGSTASGARQ